MSAEKEQAKARLKVLERELHEYVKLRIKEIESYADQYGIVHQFTGLPPFDSYGNSGWYFPVKPETGEPWLGSEHHHDHYTNHDGVLAGWVSSDQGC